jgi:tetratricopeptide (TPR) repeat protein
MEIFMKSSQAWRIALSLFFLLTNLPWMAAQQDSKGNIASGNASQTGKPVMQPTAPSPFPQITPKRISQTMWFTGNVVLEDGTPPPFGATVQIVCGGSSRKAAAVDIKGNFVIKIGGDGSPTGLIPDASEASSSGIFDGNSISRDSSNSNLPFAAQTMGSSPDMRLVGCELFAQLPGYRSTALRLDGQLFSEQNEIGTIVVYPNERVRGATVSVASMLAPKSASKSRERALKAFKKGKLDDAGELLKAAIKDYPNYSEAWFNLGQVYQKQDHNQEARDAYAKSIELDKLFVSPYVELSWLSLAERKWQEAADLTEQAIDLDPVSFPEVYYMNAVANLQLNRLDVAEKRARQEQRLDSNHQIPQVFLVLASVLSQKHDTHGTIAQLQDYLKYAPNAKDAVAVRLALEKEKGLVKAEVK